MKTTSETRTRTIAYWSTTGLVTAAFLLGGVVDIAHPPNVLATMGHLGYPLYLATLLGVWKLLGAATVLAPRSPRLKEWAYAGMFFDLTGAAVSHASSGDGVGPIVTPLVILALVIASWALRPASRAWSAAAATPSSLPGRRPVEAAAA